MKRPRDIFTVGCVCVCVCVCVSLGRGGGGVLFNSARLRKEENLNLTSVLSPELKKKKSLFNSTSHFRRKLNNLSAPFERAFKE